MSTLDFDVCGANLLNMRLVILSILLLSLTEMPVQAQVYPVDGKWGQSASSEKGRIDCTDNKRVIEFNGGQRTDSNSGVPSYRNQSVRSEGPSNYRIVDEFSTGQISSGQTSYGLRKVDADHIEVNQDGTTTKLQRCR
jgi:hypothetical protein